MQYSLNLWWDGDQLADRLDHVSIVTKHPVKAKSFRANRLTPEREGIFLADDSSRSSQPLEPNGQTFGPLPSPRHIIAMQNGLLQRTLDQVVVERGSLLAQEER